MTAASRRCRAPEVRATHWLEADATGAGRCEAVQSFVMDWKQHISIDPQVLAGKPCVAGTRIPVEQVLEHLGDGWTTEELLDQYPTLTREGILACSSFAAAYLGSEKMAVVPH